ncbi:metallophosphoesterase [Alkalicoccus daliensis]|uniref:Calcineurin-like phosphoesterase domain-containing protein n=1 Tax=Alkalicoccus daliensis TaxID=745820 RepID=A0A1G9ZEP7_9BACI|nr:metallophosphoesterase [Alkalicoccus daliensis]SDN19451.1 hypothetical protein SAMN04488053_10162 [Alkalicoccus daliensis]
MKRKSLIVITLLLLTGLGGTYFVYYQNNALVTTEISYTSAELPASFDDFRIVHLTDLHNKSFGNDQERLLSMILQADPDIIFFTGDLIDQDTEDMHNSMLLMQELAGLAPTYFVTGNHEWWSGNYEVLEAQLKDAGVNVLRNESTEIIKEEETIQLLGIDDPAQGSSYNTEALLEEHLHSAAEEIDETVFQILLSHRPEVFDMYTDYQIQLVFTGHAHGGQVRLPFIGALAAPDQGFFPEYTAGTYTQNNTTMVVNRGLGNSVIPVRVFNRPEIIVMTLHSSSQQ